MSKVALLTDQHIGVKNDSLIMLDYFDKFYTNVFFPYLEEHGIKRIIDLGDTFDRRKYVNFQTLQKARQMYFDRIAAGGYELDIILGNHSSFFRNTLEINSPELLLKDYNFKIYSEAEYIDLDGLKVLILPWITPENQERAYAMIDETKATVIMGHLEIQGFEMMRGRPCDHGISHSLFEKYMAVFSGHFHYKSFSHGIMYLGSPYEMTWADYGTPKGFHILDTEKLSIDFIENPYKMFQKVFYNDTDGEPEVNAAELDGAYVKVMVQSKTNPAAFEKFMDKLNRANATNVVVVEEPAFKTKLTAEDGSFEVEDTLTFMTKYIRRMDNLNIDKDKIVTLIDSLYHRANELEI